MTLPIRLLAGLACSVESPSRYIINASVKRRGHPMTQTCIVFTGLRWTLEWQFADHPPERSSTTFNSPTEVAQYIIDLTQRSMEYGA
jgi:hypothetical protein